MPTPQAAELTARSIRKEFGEFVALDDVSLTIGRGAFVTLLGPSGSGKTTFLMILAGFLPPTAGEVHQDGRDITALPPEARGFGMVFQGYALFPHMTVAENIAFPLKVSRRSGADIRRRVGEMIEMVGLAGHGHKRPAALSGGQQQRVALARALACEPAVLLLDEPFSALDKNLRGQMQDEVRRLHREIGTTFVFVTHDQSEALALSSTVAIFDHGRLQQAGGPQEVYERPANRFVAEFLGDINILPIAGVEARGGVGHGRFEGRAIRAVCGAAGATAGTTAGTSAALAIRPEHMRLELSEPAGGNAIPLSVTDLTYMGAETRLHLVSGGGTPVILSVPTAAMPAAATPGAAVWAAWAEDRGFFL